MHFKRRNAKIGVHSIAEALVDEERTTNEAAYTTIAREMVVNDHLLFDTCIVEEVNVTKGLFELLTGSDST